MPYKERQDKLEYLRGHYGRNKDLYKERAKRNTRKARKRNAHYVLEYLKSHPCVDCGEKDPVILTFDHTRDKHKDVSTLVRNAASLRKIQEEIDKCVVRCSNCHTRRTAEQQGWFRLLNE